MELQRIADIIRFKPEGEILPPTVEESQELARRYLVATGQAQILQYKDPDPACPQCGGSGLLETETGGEICPCSILDDPIYIIPDPANSNAPLADLDGETETVKDGD